MTDKDRFLDSDKTRLSDTDNSFNRRDFLRVGGIAVAGLGALHGAGRASNAAAADTTTAPQAALPSSNSGKKVRIGVVGGRFGAHFQWHEHPNCIVEAVTDLIPERCDLLARTYNCANKYPSMEEMLKQNKQIEAVAIFTGALDHVRHALLCLDAGKHVISAVPAGMNVEECEQLLAAVRKSGLKYMLAETSWYHQSVITARQWFKEGKFGKIHYCESEYFHPGLEEWFFEDDGSKSWRYGLPPMLYPTHCTAHLIAVTGERLSSVTCTGWGDDSPILKDNPFKNPFWNQTAMFHTDRGNALRAGIWWRGPVGGGERGDWYGEKMSFFNTTLNGLGPIVRRDPNAAGKDASGKPLRVKTYEKFDQPEHWKSDMLPEPLRHVSDHDCSHPFLTHEFIDALVHDREPLIDIYEALSVTVPGIIAHESSLKGGVQMKIPVYNRPA